jgi:hypothetical protein
VSSEAVAVFATFAAITATDTAVDYIATIDVSATNNIAGHRVTA